MDHKKARQAWSQLGGGVCLLALLLGHIHLFPGLLAAAATLDPSHSVCIGLDQGIFTLVLRHQSAQPRQADYKPQCDPANPAHRHGLIAKCVCALSNRDGHTPDHVASFSTSLVATRAPGSDGRETPATRFGGLAGPFQADTVFPPTHPDCASPPHPAAQAPPRCPLGVHLLRSVTLLI